MRICNLEGKTFGRLTVSKRVGKDERCAILWECVCSCGETKAYPTSRLNNGSVKSCGCLVQEVLKQQQVATHGEGTKRTRTPEYVAWFSMHTRCRHIDGWHNRGIRVCERWTGPGGFQNFLSDMGRRPTDGRRWSLDRINNDGNYAPENCRWATYSEQASNRRPCTRENVLTRGFCARGHEVTEMTAGYTKAGTPFCKECKRTHWGKIR